MEYGKVDWNLVYLKENPFNVSPPTNPEDAVWAGMPELKRQFDEILSEALSSSVTQVVLNRGPIGGGKTHASLYFSLQENLPHVNPAVRKVYTVRVSTPKETGKADEDFYVELLDKFGMTTIQETIYSAITELGESESLRTLRTVVGSEELARAIVLLGSEESEDMQKLLRAYFLEGCTKTELRKIGVARNITKSQDRFRVLAGVLRCFIGLSPTSKLSEHSRVCLWIDEMEDLVYFTSSQFRPFTQGLRELIDRLPNFFTLFMNFTLTSPEEYEEIEVVLGKALVDRITNPVYFPELEIDEAMEYVKELLDFYRTIDLSSKGLLLTYPFEEAALGNILEDLEKRTPRSINKRCRNAITFAFRDNRFPQQGKGIIDVDYAKKFERSELDREV